MIHSFKKILQLMDFHNSIGLISLFTMIGWFNRTSSIMITVDPISYKTLTLLHKS